MDHLNIEFLEEYKRLDKLCREIYDSDKGVTSYIEDMKKHSALGMHYVRTWDEDLKALIHIRDLRNKLKHELGTMNYTMCNDADIDLVVNFYARIIKQSDPLSTLNKISIALPEQKTDTKQKYSNSNTNANTSELLPTILIGILFVILGLLISFYL